MTISINPSTFVITVPKADLTLVSGTLYEHDTEAFRLQLISWEQSETGMNFLRTHIHNTVVSVAGLTLARVIQIIAPYSVKYEDGIYSVRLAGSNNNIFDVESGILVQNSVQVIPNNSAGLQVVSVGSGLSQSQSDELTLVKELMESDQVFDNTSGLLHYYRKGTLVDLIPPKIVSGSKVGQDSSLEE